MDSEWLYFMGTYLILFTIIINMVEIDILEFSLWICIYALKVNIFFPSFRNQKLDS